MHKNTLELQTIRRQSCLDVKM